MPEFWQGFTIACGCWIIPIIIVLTVAIVKIHRDDMQWEREHDRPFDEED